MQGTVKKWNITWGFITNEETKKDIFVHKNELANGLSELEVGQKVSYEVKTDKIKKKDQAVNVTII